MPAAYLMIIIDETRQEEESDTDREEGHEKRTDGTKIGGEMGQDGERRKKYSLQLHSPVNLSPKSPNLDKIATETLFVGNDSHTHPEQYIKNIDDRMQAKVA